MYVTWLIMSVLIQIAINTNFEVANSQKYTILKNLINFTSAELQFTETFRMLKRKVIGKSIINLYTFLYRRISLL